MTDKNKEQEQIVFKPQEGPQTMFSECSADVAVFGGACGGGKTYALLFEAARHIHVPGYTAAIFRRTNREIKDQGGLYDSSLEMYPFCGGKPNSTTNTWVFDTGNHTKASISFNHMQYESDKLSYQGSQICYLAFDEITHFSETMFFYMLSRNRSTCGVRPRVRATTNPDPDSFIRKMIDWWIDPDTGYPLPERSGVIRWFVRVEDELLWGDTKEELSMYGDATSFTFIASSLEDNKILDQKDSGYRAKLMTLQKVERERLLFGNWNIKPAAGLFFKESYFPVIEPYQLPPNLAYCRAWDRAGTVPHPGNTDPDRTVGMYGATDFKGNIYILGMVQECLSPFAVSELIRKCAEMDGKMCVVSIFKDPGSAGQYENESTIRLLSGYIVETCNTSTAGGKLVMAGPVSTQAEARNIYIVRGTWNKEFFNETSSFPEGKHDDIVDALSLLFKMLTDPDGAVRRMKRKDLKYQSATTSNVIDKKGELKREVRATAGFKAHKGAW